MGYFFTFSVLDLTLKQTKNTEVTRCGMCAFVTQILSKDSVTVAVDAVVYYRVSNATISVVNVEDAARSTRLLAQTTLRTVLGTKNLSEILSDRENISHFMQVPSQSPTARVDTQPARYPKNYREFFGGKHTFRTS